MPAKSKSQQRFFGMVRQCQKTGNCYSDQIKKVAGSISKKDAEEFASTKHKDLPNKIKSFKDWIELNESPLFKKNTDAITNDTARSIEIMDSIKLYRLLQEMSMRTNHQPTQRHAAEAAAYIAWRINNKRADVEGDLFDSQSQLGGPRCEAGREFVPTKD